MDRWQIPPIICQWDVTGRCNLNCRHCRASGLQAAGELNLSQAATIIDQLYELSPEVTLALAGGEPLMHPDLEKLMRRIRSKQPNADIELLSNGTLINSSNIGWLEELVTGFNISLEGASAVVNDAIRGVGSFEKTVKGVVLLVKNSVPVCMRMTFFHQDEVEVERLMRFLPQLGVKFFNFRYLVPVGNAQKQDVSADQYRRLSETIWGLGQELGLEIGYSDPFPELLINPLEKKKNEEDEAVMIGQAVNGCSIAFQLLYLDPQGIVRACPYLPVFCADAKELSLAKIWFKNPVLNKLRYIRSLLSGKCGRCKYKFACGGCRGAAWATGDFLGEDPRCWYEA